MAQPKYYLRGLNTLRFFAAMLVVIFHCNDALRQVDEALMSRMPIFFKGPQAVDFFFVISGYLLTYLACHEYAKHGRLDVKAFFARRVLRIFPLYYLAVFLGLFLIGYLYPKIYGQTFLSFTFAEGLPYYLFFLPNYVIVAWENIGPLYMLWSIGVEEQFYLLFPFMMILAFRLKKPLLIIGALLVLYSLFYFGVAMGYVVLPSLFEDFVVKTLRFHYLLYGALLGAGLYYVPRHIGFRILEHWAVQAAIWVAFLISLFTLTKGSDPHNLVGVILFSLVMINVSKPNSVFNIEFRPFIYLGMISYGIYIFHPFVSIGVRFLMERISGLHGVLTGIPVLFYILVTAITIGLAHISYRYYEGFFLKKKGKFVK